ncbi:MAG: hypothetical protein B7Z18_09595 [Alishewanella sp. 32-51-5]|nr:MAG: hypothetical protein B7Z18_09595 [Alishewanella sp. 32-51-5]
MYTVEEYRKIDTAGQGFLMFLEQINVLDATTREMVIDRVMDLDAASISLEDLKWVVLMVLFNVPGKETAYAQMEDLIFDEVDGPLH